MNVPEALARAWVEEPSMKRADDVDWVGMPLRKRARPPLWRDRVDPVAFTKVRPERMSVAPWMARVDERLTPPVAVNVATWKLALPVALVKVMPVEETVLKVPVFVTESEPTEKLPDPVALVKVKLLDEAVPKVAVFVTWRATPDPWIVRVVPVEFMKVRLVLDTVVA